MTVADTFIALLRSAVTGAGAGEEIPVPDPGALYSAAKFHDLAHVVFYELEKRKALPEGETYTRFKRVYDAALFRHACRTVAISQIREALNGGKIPYVLLKGAVLMGLYPDAWMRTSSDVDVLVREEDFDRAARLFEESGMTFTVKGSHDASFDTQYHVHVELHYTLIEEYRYPQTAAVLEKVWDHAVPAGEGGSEYVLDDAMFYYYHVAHMVKHMEEGGCGVRPFLDLWLLDHRTEFDGGKRKALLEEGGISGFAEKAVKMSEIWFSGESSEPLYDDFARYVLRGGVSGTFDNRVANLTEKRKKRGLSYYLSRVFPPVAEMKGRYPVLQKKPFLIPFYWLKRLFSLLSPSTKKRAKAEVAAARKLDGERTKEAASLMERLEIWKKDG